MNTVHLDSPFNEVISLFNTRWLIINHTNWTPLHALPTRILFQSTRVCCFLLPFFLVVLLPLFPVSSKLLRSSQLTWQQTRVQLIWFQMPAYTQTHTLTHREKTAIFCYLTSKSPATVSLSLFSYWQNWKKPSLIDLRPMRVCETYFLSQVYINFQIEREIKEQFVCVRVCVARHTENELHVLEACTARAGLACTNENADDDERTGHCLCGQAKWFLFQHHHHHHYHRPSQSTTLIQTTSTVFMTFLLVYLLAPFSGAVATILLSFRISFANQKAREETTSYVVVLTICLLNQPCVRMCVGQQSVHQLMITCQLIRLPVVSIDSTLLHHHQHCRNRPTLYFFHSSCVSSVCSFSSATCFTSARDLLAHTHTLVTNHWSIIKRNTYGNTCPTRSSSFQAIGPWKNVQINK